MLGEQLVVISLIFAASTGQWTFTLYILLPDLSINHKYRIF
jgi:hypothetical protein